MNDIAKLFRDWEEDETDPKYVVDNDTYKAAKGKFFGQLRPARTKPVKYTSNSEEIFVVSDLHIASGKNYCGIYRGTENFFADESFKRFLEYADKEKETDNAMLIINGDIFDFLRITHYPGKERKLRLSKWIKHPIRFWPRKKPTEASTKSTDEQFKEWSAELEKLGMNKSYEELKNTITPTEKKYGLGTEDFKTIYKIFLIKKGHPEFINALGKWLEQGNKLIIVKGNHDLELFWPEVRNYIRLVIAEDIQRRNGTSNLVEILENKVLPSITFIDDSIVIDNDFYVEHGHRYDKFCTVLENAFLDKNPKQINIPFGSFLNRYVINKIERFFPFIDNVRPTGNVLPMLMKANFPLGLKILFQHIPALFKMLIINFRYFWFMFNEVFWFLLAILTPVAIMIALYITPIKNFLVEFIGTIGAGGITSIVFDQLTNIFFLILSYLLARLVAWFQLSEPSSLDKFAKERFKGTDYKIMVMGHTHNPGQYCFNDGLMFYNCGTWIPIIETSSTEVRKDKTYTFLHLTRGKDGKLELAKNGLRRWNDDAGRSDPQVLVQRK
jgi:UDP-2,3-diacylglucosamine pyrophosphatase LpxH